MDRSVIDNIINFLTAIGVDVILRPLNQDTFLPGLQLENGKIIIDKDKLLYPGDILHEAGHLAGYPPDVRETIGDPLPGPVDGGLEMMALAWSYAAAVHIGLEPSVVFHADGYKGGAAHLIELFESGQYLGLNMLQYMGMAYDEKNAKELNVLPFPHMVNWLKNN